MKNQIRRRCWCFTLVAVFIFLHGSVFAEPPTVDESANMNGIKTVSMPGLADLADFASDLSMRRTKLNGKVVSILDINDARKKLGDIDESVNNLSLKIQKTEREKDYSFEQLNEIKIELRRQSRLVEKANINISQALMTFEAFEKEWLKEKAQLDKWQAILSKDNTHPQANSIVDRALNTVSEALNSVAQHLQPVLMVDQIAGSIHNQIQSLSAELGMLISNTMATLLQVSSPPMYSLEYYSQLKKGLKGELLKGSKITLWPVKQPVAWKIWLLMLQVLLVLFSFIGIIRNRAILEGSEHWKGITKRPLSASIFISITPFCFFYSSTPSIWYSFIWSIACIALARMVGGFLTGFWKRWLVYGSAALLVAIHVFRIIHLPIPIFRLFGFYVSVFGMLLCIWRAIKHSGRKESLLYSWALCFGGLIFFGVIVSEVFGYSKLALHIIESLLKTALLLLIPWMLFKIIIGSMELTIHNPFFQNIPLIQKRTHIILDKSDFLIKLLLNTFFFCAILVVWRIYGTPLEAFHGLLSKKLTMGSLEITLGMVSGAVIILYGALLISRTVQAILREEILQRRHIETGVQISITRLVHYGFMLVGFLFTLSVLGFDAKNITIIGGALGVGIGFGLQNIVSNFISGLILLFERPVKVGDIIEIGNQRAHIKKVGLRATVVQTYDRAEIVVPNSDLISNQVTNWTLADRVMRIIVPVSVAYGSDVALVMKLLKTCAEENSSVLKYPDPQILFLNFGESALDFQLRVWIADVEKRSIVISELNQEIDRQFREAGVEIPFPQRDLHIRNINTSAVSQPKEDKSLHSKSKADQET